MSIEAINTARLQTQLPANVILGNGKTGAASKASGADQAPEKPAVAPDLTISNGFMDALNTDLEAIHNVGLQFSVHNDTGQTVVRVVDKDSGKLIRQIPPQELLDLAAKLEDMMGILFDKNV